MTPLQLSNLIYHAESIAIAIRDSDFQLRLSFDYYSFHLHDEIQDSEDQAALEQILKTLKVAIDSNHVEDYTTALDQLNLFISTHGGQGQYPHKIADLIYERYTHRYLFDIKTENMHRYDYLTDFHPTKYGTIRGKLISQGYAQEVDSKISLTDAGEYLLKTWDKDHPMTARDRHSF